jgi:predicted O-methyltransferase YrrM
MNLTRLFTIVSGTLLGLTLVLPASAAEPMNAEAREAYLKNFKRIGLNTTPGDAMMLRILVASSKAKRGVEVGSATGYGAMQMGIAFERNGGHLTTVDIDPKMVKATRDNLAKMGLEKTVTVVEGDALKVLPGLEGEYDFVFLDALKRDYLKYFQALAPKLKPGAVVVADNVIQSEREMKNFLDAMAANKDFEGVTIRASLDKNDGMAVYYKVR